MTPEQFDRLECIAKLLAKPCPRVSRRKTPKLSTEEYIRAGGFMGVYGARLARLAKPEEYTDRMFDALIEELGIEFDGDLDEL